MRFELLCRSQSVSVILLMVRFGSPPSLLHWLHHLTVIFGRGINCTRLLIASELGLNELIHPFQAELVLFHALQASLALDVVHIFPCNQIVSELAVAIRTKVDLLQRSKPARLQQSSCPLRRVPKQKQWYKIMF